MTRDIEILKNLYLPEIEEMYPFAPELKTAIQQDAFWDHFNTILFDTNEIANFFHRYKVAKAEYYKKNSILIKDDNPLDFIRFEQIKREYISYLASDYCNGETNPTIEFFLKIQFKPFIEEVSFQQEIKQAITITEREKLKKKLSMMDAAAEFEITDDEITSAFQLLEKKNEYEQLKRKMQDWDKAEKQVYTSVTKTSRTIRLSFIRYAVAACFIGAMVWIGIKFYTQQPKENNLASSKPDTAKSKTNSLTKPKPEFAKVGFSQNIIPLEIENGLGFGKAAKTGKLNIVIQDVGPRIASIEKFLEKPENYKVDSTLIQTAKDELSKLNKLTFSYIFDGVTVHIFRTLNAHVQNIILMTSDKKYYFKEGENFYQLKKTDQPLEFKKVTDRRLKEKLDRVVFDNEK